MSDQMPHDEELRAAYRKLPADEPRAEIDDAILAAARRRGELEGRRTLIRRIRWTVPLAAAAGVVLTMTLTRLTPERADAPALLEESPRETAALAPRAESPAEKALAERQAPAAVDDARRNAGAVHPDAARHGTAEHTPAAPAGPPAPAPLAKQRTAKPEATRTEPQPEAKRAAPGVAAAPSAGGAALGDMAAMETDSAAKREEHAGEPHGHDTPRDAGSTAAYCEAEPVTPEEQAATLRAEAALAAARAIEAIELRRWPFGLEPWLDAEEACRRLRAALASPCEFRGDVAVVRLVEPRPVDAGLLRGEMASQLTLTRRDGKLATVELRSVLGGRQMLVAPEEVR